MAADAKAASAELERYMGCEVVLDTRGPLTYLGLLERCDEVFFVLTAADVHDTQRGGATKERYVLEARKHGVRKNREEVLVRRDEVTSLSRLEDVTVY